MRVWTKGIAKQVGTVEIDMTPFMTKDDGKERILVARSNYSNTYIEVQIEFRELEGTGEEESSGGSMLRFRKKLKD